MDLPQTIAQTPDYLLGVEKGQQVLVPIDSDTSGRSGQDTAGVAKFTPAQQAKAPTGIAPLLDVNGQLIDKYGNQINAAAALAGVNTRSQNAGIWLPFSNYGTKPRLQDRASNIIMTANGALKLREQMAVAIAITTGVVTETGHPLMNGDVVYLTGITGAAGLTQGTPYFVTGATANTYGLALTPAGAVVTTTTAGTATRFSRPSHAVPGVTFTGSVADYLQSNITQQGALQKSIFNLSTLSEDGSDCIVFFCEFTHALGVPGGTDATLFFWGRRNPATSGNGWGVSVIAAPANIRLQFETCAGGMGVQRTDINLGMQFQGDGPGGSGGTGANQRSAVAMMIYKLPKAFGDQNNFFNGTGGYVLETAKMGLTDQGYFGQKNYQVTHVPRYQSGATGEASFCDTGLTIGATPTTAANVLVEPLLATQGVDNMGFYRRKRQSGLVSQIVRQMAANYQANPNLKVQPACISV